VRPLLARIRTAAWVVGAPARWLLIGTIKLYRVVARGFLGGQCRFHPSCSAYAEQAVRQHGAVRGAALAAWRILRCTPLSRGGFDPVPERRRMPPLYDSVIQPVGRRTA
jgi:putative membrane protein insertion efficiency factor